jgi:hypothetical protein
VSEDGMKFSAEYVKKAVNIVEVRQIEIPSVVFCQLPDDKKDR